MAPAAPSPSACSRSLRLKGSVEPLQLGKFLLVGASGYAINIAVFVVFVRIAGASPLRAATVAFVASVANNYTWNRLWTFRHQRRAIVAQGIRFLFVSLGSYGASLLLLSVLLRVGFQKIGSQALAIVLVTPLNFAGNKLWSFRADGPIWQGTLGKSNGRKSLACDRGATSRRSHPRRASRGRAVDRSPGSRPSP